MNAEVEGGRGIEPRTLVRGGGRGNAGGALMEGWGGGLSHIFFLNVL